MLPVERIANAIHTVRGQRVMLDADLAALYGVSTKRLNEQVRRNRNRFPPDFAFQLTDDESGRLRSQIATSNTGRGGRRYTALAFTEHGALMLANVLKSPAATQVSVRIVRAFVTLRGMLAEHAELARKLDDLERRYDAQFASVFQAIRRLMEPPPVPERRRIGFVAAAERRGGTSARS
jgi:hypothetical protein